jgi:hypothetical protein
MRSIRRQNNNVKLVFVFFLAITIYITYLLFNGGINNNLSNLLIDISLLVLSFFIFLFFFSIFIIPFKEIKDLIPIFHRVLLFMTGKHGLISHVNNGVKTEKNVVSTKNNPGLILLDSSSAAVIGKTTRYHRTVGPGVVFTQKSDVIADTVDLQLQKKIIGPLEGENPYSEKQKNENPSSYTSRVQRASETKAVTRDGIEIVATFSLTFKIKSKPGEGNSPFGYDSLSVERAILGQAVNTNSEPQYGSPKNWTILPGLLAMGIWRDLIHKYKLNELFQVNGSQIDYCLENILFQLTHQKYEELDEFGKKKGNYIPSREYQLLEDRGIDFLGIQLNNFSFPPEIEDGLANQWESSWMKISNNEQAIISRLHNQAIADGKQSGNKLIAEITSQIVNKLAAERILTSKNLINQVLSTYEHQSRKKPVFLDYPLNKEKKDLS